MANFAARNNQTEDGIDLKGTSYITVTGFDVENPSGTIVRAGIRAVSDGVSNAQGVIIENNTTNNCGTWGIFTSHEDGILIQNNITSNSQGQHGIYVSNASVNPVVEGNTSFGNADAGIQLNGDLSQGGTGLIIGALIAGNIIHDNGAGAGGSAINLDGVQSSTIENNLLYNNHSSGISLFKIDGAAGSINNVVVNNTFVMASDARWVLNIQGGSTGNTIFDNILYNASTSNGSIDTSTDSLPGLVSDYNVVVDRFTPNDNSVLSLSQWRSQTGQDVHSVISTPGALFINPAANNYKELSTSPSVDAGVSSLAGHNAPTVDIVGTTRPQGSAWDIGAYELVSALGVATHFSVTAVASTTAGSPFSITVTALDSSNHTATAYLGIVHFTSTDSQSILPANYAFTAGDAGVHTFTNGVTLKTAGAKIVTATDTLTSTITGSASVTVNPAAAASFVVAGYPSPVTAGTMNNFTVTAKDPYGNTATGYTGTVTFGTSAAKMVLPTNYTFTGADAGIHTFSATLRTAGTQSLTAKDIANNSIAGSQTGIVVNPAATNHLAVSRFPSPTTAGVSQSFRVTAQDMFGNTTPGFIDTVSFSSTDSQSVLPANYTFTSLDAGVHTFPGILKTAGSQSLTAQALNDTNVAAGTMPGITVNPAAASGLKVSGFPSSVIAGTANNFMVTAVDPYGNIATGYRGTMTFSSSSDSHAVLPANYAFISGDAGVHTLSATLNTQGPSQSITATDTVNAGIKGTESGISVVSMQPTAGIVGPGVNLSGSNGVAGQPLAFTLSASESGLPAGTTYSYSVQWGDGSLAQAFSGPSGTQATHAFPAPGSYSISVMAADPSGNGSLPASTSVSVTTLAMETDPYNSSLTALYLGGTTSSDNIAITPATQTGGVKVGMNLVNYGSFSPTGHVVVYSQAGNDVIKTAAQTFNGVLTYVNVSVLFIAGNGNDVLNVSGSSASNVLVGGGGTDRLIGGQGQDILIGGAGQATLQAGSGGDILVGGTTAYDNNAAALAAILAEWSRTDIDYATRIAHLTGSTSGGLNGSYLLNASTVQGNSLADNLYGGAGMDWFFAGMADVLFDTTTGEVVTPI